MIVQPNSNFRTKHGSLDHRDQQQPASLLLKPTGVPVFNPVSTQKTSAQDYMGMTAATTLESTSGYKNYQSDERTVRAKSFVIGKKVENQTGISLIELESMTIPQDKQFPVKVIFEKRSHEVKLFERKGKEEITKNVTVKPQEKENITLNARNLQTLDQVPMELPIAKDFPKNNAVVNASKLQEMKHRPKSATTQQIKKDSIKHSKLGPNTSVKPQISYVKKVQSQQRPLTAKLKVKEALQAPLPPPQSAPSEVPFAHNRLKGQFESITKDLIKKAQEALKEEKNKALKDKEDLACKKEKLKLISDEVKKQNQELLLKQKEKGTQHGELKAKEEERKQAERKKEQLMEKQRKQELRDKRKEDTRKQLGLEILDEQRVEEYRRKKKEAQREMEEQTKSGKTVVDHLKAGNEKREKPHLLVIRNRDLKEAIKEDRELQEVEEDEEQKKIDRQKLLREQQKKRKLMLREQAQKAEEEGRKREEGLKKLQLDIKVKADEDRKKQDIRSKVQEERERIQQELEQETSPTKQPLKKKKKAKASHHLTHKEQFNDLKDWIDEQMVRGEEILEMNESLLLEQPSNIDIKITQKHSSNDNSQNNNNSSLERIQLQRKNKQSSKIDSRQSKSNHQEGQLNMMAFKHEMPGNSDIPVLEDLKYGVREDRYGIFGDNGYSDLIEIKRRDLSQEQYTQNEQEHQKEEMRLSKDGLISIISKIKDYQQQKETSMKKAVIDEIVRAQQESRLIINQQQQAEYRQDAYAVPGVVNIEKELQLQREQQRQVEIYATITIQQWARGYFARQQVRARREAKRRDIEAEYGYFDDQVKFNADYNLQKFLKDKQKLRNLSKTKGIINESASIQEKIGDSSQSQSKSFRGKSAPQAAYPTQMNNYFRSNARSDKDPLSLIEIYAKKHAPKVVPSVVKSPIKHESQHKRQQHLKGSHSDIEEEIYSENFDEDEVKSRRTDNSISEDLVEGSKGSSSFKESARQKRPFNYQQSASIIEESIQEDLLSRSRRSPDKRDDSSIIEESGLQHHAFLSKSSAQKKGSIIEEDSIPEDYEGQEFDSSSKAQNKKQKDKQHLLQVANFEKKMKADEAKRKGLVNEMLDEMKRYEQASVSTIVVERVEKIITQSLAQKDKLLMGQRLHELEMQRTHQEEINKIREEQIKLMSLLMLQGAGNKSNTNNEEDQQRVLDEIRRIIDKPIVIQHQEVVAQQRAAPKIKVQNTESEDDEYQSDYIEESKGLSKMGREDLEEDSIRESIRPDDESIVEDIADEDDEIKESIHVEGRKLQEKKTTDKQLQKMRLAMGSEESLRYESKKALRKSNHQDHKSSGIFEKHSFQDFTSQKFKQLLFDEKARDNFMKEVELEIEHKRIIDEEKLHKELKKNLISPRTYKKRSNDLEKWVINRKTELQKNKINMFHSMEELGTYMERLDKDKKSMIEKIGSPRVPSKLTHSQSSIEYGSLDEESNESLRIRQARDQLKKLTTDLDRQDPEAKEIERKKLAAQKLIREKEKAIEEGLKTKLRQIEGQQADQMLNLALNLDIDKEIERRIGGARQALVEESSKFDDNSARGSVSQSVGIFANEDPKRKKNVKFASPEQRFSSAHSHDQSSAGASSGRYKSSQKFDDSIGESIKIEESYSIVSQHTQNQASASLKKSISKDKIQESIKESIPEDQNDYSIGEDYSEDFEQSQASVQSAQNATIQSRNKLLAKLESQPKSALEDYDIEYSMNFDESIGQSQQLAQIATKHSNGHSVKVEKVDEESGEDEDGKSEMLRSQSSKIKDSDDVQEEEEVESESIGTSSKMIDSSAIDLHEDDKEILQSAQSVEWVVTIGDNVESQRSKKKSEEDDGYSEDFEEIEDQIEDKQESEEANQSKQIDELESLQSVPDDVEDDEEKANRITDEFLELLLEEIKLNSDLKLGTISDIDDFKDKFPFNLEPPKEEPKEELRHFKSLIPVQEEKKVEPPKKIKQEDPIVIKFESETKKLQNQTKLNEKYLDMLISNIRKQELISLLDKPIEIDPLKKLSQIFSQDNAEESFNHMNESGPQTILSLDFFMKVEDLFTILAQKEQQNLTESARQSYLKHESVHHKALFDAFNQALDIERPYKEKGNPAPWSKQTRVVKHNLTEKQLDHIMQKAKQRVLFWNQTNAGTRVAPLPPPPPANQDYDQSAPPQQPSSTEEERINQAREDKLGVLMMRELEENEQKWIDYEDEDTQARFDLADMVLEELAGEFANIMMEIQNRRM